MFWRRDAEVLIAGAGPVGLLAGVVLAERGVAVQILDEQPTTAARSYALALHPRTLELLDDLGLARELLDQGRRLDTVGFYEKGERQAEARYAGVSARFPFLLVVPQHVLEDALERRLHERRVHVFWNHRVAEVHLGEHEVEATVHRLAKEASGYSVASSEWVVEKQSRIKAGFLIGADGHRSAVRRALGIPFEPMGPSQLFAVFEFAAEGADLHEARVVLDGRTESVLWPLGEGSFRFAFELEDAPGFVAEREKSRAVVLLGDRSFHHLERTMLERLVRERAPWFDARLGEVAWSLAVRFERRLAREFGRGRVWLAGDAAHLAPPLGVQSLNVGLREAVALATRMHAVARGEASPVQLEDYGRDFGREWRALLREGGGLEAGPRANDFVRRHAGRLGACLPATLADLPGLVAQMGLVPVAS